MVMKKHPPRITPKNTPLLLFFLLVFGISAIFWSIGAVVEQLIPELPGNLPFSSLMVVSPIIAACYCTYKENGLSSLKELLKRTFDYKKVERQIWYLLTLLLMPTVMGIEYGILRLMHRSIPDMQNSFSMSLGFFFIFFIAAVGEEIGWHGYVIDRLQARWNALTASILLGIIWGAWHIIPMIQMQEPPLWITWQCINIAVTRILMVWIYNNAGKSVFVTVLFHAVYNVSTLLFAYDPFIVTPILIVIALAVSILWGPKTLAEYNHLHQRKVLSQA
jgi:membrane protease YdiL (CAAX protease family)